MCWGSFVGGLAVLPLMFVLWCGWLLLLAWIWDL
jgi:hypothetical protein